MELEKRETKVIINYENYKVLHTKIKASIHMIGVSLFNYVQALKEMHDTKLYIAAGYTSFEEYTYAAFNVKKSQAYDIMALSCFTKDFLKEHGNLGVAKLRTLTSLPEEEASNFIYENEIENYTVSEVKKKVKSYKSKVEEIIIDVELETPHEEVSEDVIVKDPISFNTFGEFLKAKRNIKNIGTKEMSELLLVSRSYYLNIENNRRMPTNEVFFKILIKYLELSSFDVMVMYELRDKYYFNQNRIAPDINSYIKENRDIKELIRKIKDGKLTKEYWNEQFERFNS